MISCLMCAWPSCFSRVAFGEDAEDMPCPLWGRKARDFAEDIATRAIPLSDLGVNVDGFGKRLVALRVVRIDGLPRRQDEH